MQGYKLVSSCDMFHPALPKLGVDTEVSAGSRKERTRKEDHARSMRKSLKLDEKMTAHVGSKKNKEEKKMKMKETPEDVGSKKNKDEKKMKTKETPEDVGSKKNKEEKKMKTKETPEDVGSKKNKEEKKMKTKKNKEEKKMKTKKNKDEKKMKTKKNKEEKKMTVLVGSKNEEEEKMKTKETPEVDRPPWVLPSSMGGYDGPTFSKSFTRFKVDPSSGKRKREVVVRLSKEILEFMVNHPLSPPREPVPVWDPRTCALQEEFFAEAKARYETRQIVLKQYKERGYAEMVVDVPDDEEE